jgi:hypothetical protein
LLAALFAAAVSVEETRHGWRLELPAEARSFRLAASWVALERRCCPFVGFRLEWTRAGRVRLEARASGPAREALLAGIREVTATRTA